MSAPIKLVQTGPTSFEARPDLTDESADRLARAQRLDDARRAVRAVRRNVGGDLATDARALADALALVAAALSDGQLSADDRDLAEGFARGALRGARTATDETEFVAALVRRVEAIVGHRTPAASAEECAARLLVSLALDFGAEAALLEARYFGAVLGLFLDDVDTRKARAVRLETLLFEAFAIERTFASLVKIDL